MKSTASAVAEVVRTREPVLADGPRVATLVREVGGLDRNSDYTYLLLCSHFAETCVLAERAGTVVGFVSGYRLPNDPTVLFVWQVAVSPTCRGRGVASRMLDALLERRTTTQARFLEATVTPSNTASQRLFRGAARRWDASCRERTLFGAELFPEGDHEPEILFRIGPFSAPDVGRPERKRSTAETTGEPA